MSEDVTRAVCPRRGQPNVGRLRLLIGVLRRIAADPAKRDRFLMSYWFHVRRRTDDERNGEWCITPPPFQGLPEGSLPASAETPWTSCGTAGCALGWFATSDEAMRDGWTFGPLGDAAMMCPWYGSGPNGLFESGRAYFGLTTEQFDFLFIPGSYTYFGVYWHGAADGIPPEAVIRHAEILIRDTEAVAAAAGSPEGNDGRE